MGSVGRIDRDGEAIGGRIGVVIEAAGRGDQSRFGVEGKAAFGIVGEAEVVEAGAIEGLDVDVGYGRSAGDVFVDRWGSGPVDPHVVDHRTATIVSGSRLDNSQGIARPGAGDHSTEGLPTLIAHLVGGDALEDRIVPAKLEVVCRSVSPATQGVDEDQVLRSIGRVDALFDPVETDIVVIEFDDHTATTPCSTVGYDQVDKTGTPDLDDPRIGPA